MDTMSSIEHHGKTIPYTIKQSARSRSVRLSIHHDGSVVISLPQRVALFHAEKFLKQKAAWILTTLERITRAKQTAPFTGTRQEYEHNKFKALKLAKERLKYFNDIYQLPYKKVSIRNQKTRWGSCSKKGDLSFSYKIALLRPELTDYIIVHELSHIGEFNHSRKFWQLVGKTIPYYINLRRELVKISSGR